MILGYNGGNTLTATLLRVSFRSCKKNIRKLTVALSLSRRSRSYPRPSATSRLQSAIPKAFKAVQSETSNDAREARLTETLSTNREDRPPARLAESRNVDELAGKDPSHPPHLKSVPLRPCFLSTRPSSSRTHTRSSHHHRARGSRCCRTSPFRLPARPRQPRQT